MEENSWQKDLPDDLILNHILPLLPIKPLTKCKVLSKHYNSCISSPNFILKYTKQPLIYHPGTPVETLFIQSGDSFYLYSCATDDNVPKFRNGDCYNDENKLIKLNVNFGDEVTRSSFLAGCSNGLICLGQNRGKYFILYNPATNQSHTYYSTDFELLRKIQPPVTWGFGFVPSLDDYKVVRIMMYENMVDENGARLGIAHVFSHQNNNWKRVHFSSLEGGFYSGHAILANETLYWHKMQPSSTLAFDLVSDTFEWFGQIVPEPLSWGGPRMRLVGGCLGVIGGCISKCASNSENEVIIDILNRFGNMVSVCFSCDYEVGHLDEIIGLTKTGKVFVTSPGGKLGLIDQTSMQIFALFNRNDETHIRSYFRTEASPLPSSEESSSPSQGTCSANSADLLSHNTKTST